MSVNDPMMESKHHDPMLDGITAYTMDVECMSYCYGGSPRLEEDKYPDDNCVVKWSDLPALIAAARAEERERIQSEALDAITMHVLTGEDHAAFLYRLDRILNPEWKP